MHTSLNAHQQNCQKNGNHSYQTLTTRQILSGFCSQSAKGKVCCTTPGSSDLLCLRRQLYISLTSADGITVESSPFPALSPSQHSPRPSTLPVPALSPSKHSPRPSTLPVPALSPSQRSPRPSALPVPALSPSKHSPRPSALPVPALSPSQRSPRPSTLPVPALSSSQEEADRRIILHCFHVATSSTSDLIVRSPDVFMLLLYYGNRIEQNVYFDTGFANKRRLMDMNCLIRKHGELMCSAILALYAFSGRDSTSAFIREGKSQPERIW